MLQGRPPALEQRVSCGEIQGTLGLHQEFAETVRAPGTPQHLKRFQRPKPQQGRFNSKPHTAQSTQTLSLSVRMEGCTWVFSVSSTGTEALRRETRTEPE